MSIELVRWRDAHHHLDEPDEWPDDYIVETVGWVEVDGSWLIVRMEALPSNDGYRGISRIPRENVVDRIRLTAVRDTGDPGGPGGYPFGVLVDTPGETIPGYFTQEY